MITCNKCIFWEFQFGDYGRCKRLLEPGAELWFEIKVESHDSACIADEVESIETRNDFGCTMAMRED